jgi:hypothetical protein
MTTKSYKPQVQTDTTGQWYGNALRFATYEEALASAADLFSRWTLVREYRAVESDDKVNYQWHPTLGLVRLPEEKVNGSGT